jgi:undecaprenyl-diphosphatase
VVYVFSRLAPILIRNAVNPINFIIAGLGLFLVGLSHLHPRVNTFESLVFLALHRRLRQPAALFIFRLAWPLGKTPFTIFLLLLLFFLQDSLLDGLILGLTWASAVLIERVVKLYLRRTRPFLVEPDTRMLQPRPPTDPSFPSGDALRIWFTMLALAAVLGGTWYLVGIGIIVASCVSLGRIAMGVHYPLDVLAGSGLGILVFGIWLALIAVI